MDLKIYYRKIREAESGITDKDVVAVSFETPDGGRPGVMTEVSKRLAARLIVEKKGRLATKEEAAAYRREVAEAHEEAKRLAEARRVRVTIIPETELRAPRRPATKPAK